jgi:hypothetical protein
LWYWFNDHNLLDFVAVSKVHNGSYFNLEPYEPSSSPQPFPVPLNGREQPRKNRHEYTF